MNVTIGYPASVTTRTDRTRYMVYWGGGTKRSQLWDEKKVPVGYFYLWPHLWHRKLQLENWLKTCKYLQENLARYMLRSRMLLSVLGVYECIPGTWYTTATAYQVTCATMSVNVMTLRYLYILVFKRSFHFRTKWYYGNVSGPSISGPSGTTEMQRKRGRNCTGKRT